MVDIVYKHNDVSYDVTKLVPEGQKAFQLLHIAEQETRNIEDRMVIAQAAVVALHTKVQEYLQEDAIFTEEETEPQED